MGFECALCTLFWTGARRQPTEQLVRATRLEASKAVPSALLPLSLFHVSSSVKTLDYIPFLLCLFLSLALGTHSQHSAAAHYLLYWVPVRPGGTITGTVGGTCRLHCLSSDVNMDSERPEGLACCIVCCSMFCACFYKSSFVVLLGISGSQKSIECIMQLTKTYHNLSGRCSFNETNLQCTTVLSWSPTRARHELQPRV
jgi:hypothetical protein